MTFDKVISKLTPFLHQHGFHISETFKNYIKYESAAVTYTFIYDEREKSFSSFVGRRNGSMTELSSDVLTNVFQQDLSNYKNKSVVETEIYFLQGGGQGLITGDQKTLNQLEQYSKVSAKKYTDVLLRAQNIRAADKAWEEKNYTQFIKSLDQIDKNTLTKSYLKKYEIASKRRIN